MVGGGFWKKIDGTFGRDIANGEVAYMYCVLTAIGSPVYRSFKEI